MLEETIKLPQERPIVDPVGNNNLTNRLGDLADIQSIRLDHVQS
jgi:hypothetical protein